MINVSIVKKGNPQKPEEPKKAYGVAQYTEKITLAEFAEHISSHNSVYDKADITAVLTKAVSCMRENLLAGKKIELGDLGEFYVTVNSQGVDNAEDYNPAIHVKAVNVNWTPGEKFQDLLAEAVFSTVPDRKSAKALAKAIKAGAKTVTIGGEAASDSDDASDTGTSDKGSTDSGTSGSGTASGGSSSSGISTDGDTSTEETDGDSAKI